MAHAARVSELADNLVRSVLGVDSDDPVIAQVRPAVAKGLKDHSHGRINQFDVKARLEGLAEKFAVLNRDDLSNALQTRLNELPARGKWLPEILALFLSLSDRPVENTQVDALASLHAEEHPDKQLTWDDILADDPLDEPGLWDDVERGYHSSGDETGFGDEIGSQPTDSTQATTIDDDSTEQIARALVVQPDSKTLGLFRNSHDAHSQAGSDSSRKLSEMAVIRESLFMLRGVPTDLYELNARIGVIQPRPNTTIATACPPTVRDALGQFADLGSSLHSLRIWSRGEQSLPYIRACQACVERLLVELGSQLAALEGRFVGISVDVIVSMIEVLAEVQSLSRHLKLVSSIIRNLSSTSPFALLDALFDKASAAQLDGDDEAFEVLTSILFQGTQTYLRPVGAWISSGRVRKNEPDFIVAESGLSCEPGDLWHRKYVLRLLDDQSPSAPNFLKDDAAEIFALGKAKMFLDTLTQGLVEDESSPVPVHGLDFDLLRKQIENDPLMPFSELLHEALKNWISSISIDVTPALKESILVQHGFLDLVAAINATYLSADGALFRDFSQSLFERMERKSSNYSNNFLLTELARETLGEASSVVPESLSINVNSNPGNPTSTTLALETIQLSYHIPWPLQNITREASPQSHAQAFSLLLQVSHAYEILQSQTFALRALHSTPLNATLQAALGLRQTLLVFTATLREHITTAARVLIAELHSEVLQAQDIDALVRAYAAHKHRLETTLLLTPALRPLLDTAVSALSLCERCRPLWESATKAGGPQASALLPLRQLQREVDGALSFTRAGVRSVSRAGGEVLLEVLAQRLEDMTAERG